MPSRPRENPSKRADHSQQTRVLLGWDEGVSPLTATVHQPRRHPAL